MTAMTSDDSPMVKSIWDLGKKLCEPCAGREGLKGSAIKSVLKDDEEIMEGIFCSVLH